MRFHRLHLFTASALLLSACSIPAGAESPAADPTGASTTTTAGATTGREHLVATPFGTSTTTPAGLVVTADVLAPDDPSLDGEEVSLAAAARPEPMSVLRVRVVNDTGRLLGMRSLAVAALHDGEPVEKTPYSLTRFGRTVRENLKNGEPITYQFLVAGQPTDDWTVEVTGPDTTTGEIVPLALFDSGSTSATTDGAGRLPMLPSELGAPPLGAKPQG